MLVNYGMHRSSRDDRKRFTITQNCSPGSYAMPKRNTAVGCIVAMKVGFGKAEFLQVSNFFIDGFPSLASWGLPELPGSFQGASLGLPTKPLGSQERKSTDKKILT